jgi:hypothetical protein
MFCKLKTGEAIVSPNPPLAAGQWGYAPDPFLKKDKDHRKRFLSFLSRDKYSFQTVKKMYIVFAAIT